MPLEKLNMTPAQDAYSMADGDEVLYQQLEGGGPRLRKDIENSFNRVNVQWDTTQAGYKYLRAFFITATKKGALPFLIDLIIDEAILTEHEANFVPNTFRLSGVQGSNAFTVNAALDVKPIAPDDEYNQTIIDIYGAYDSFDAANSAIEQLDILTNTDLPEILGP